jgi:hypothetical protein
MRPEVKAALITTGGAIVVAIIGLIASNWKEIKSYLVKSTPSPTPSSIQSPIQSPPSEPSESPTSLPSPSVNKENVINSGAWWAEYYLDNFGSYQGDGEFPEQRAWGNVVGQVWGISRPEIFDGKAKRGFSIRLYAKRQLEPGTYQFNARRLNTGNLMTVRMNGREVFSGGGRPQKFFYDSNGGWHDIEIEYRNTGGNAQIQLDWARA